MIMTRRNTKAIRVVLAAVLSPIFPGLLIAIVSLILGSEINRATDALWLIKVSAIVWYTAALALGLPLLFFLTKYEFFSVTAYVISGCLVGLGALLFYMAPLKFGDGIRVAENFRALAPIFFPLAIISGAIVGLIYWLISRPDCEARKRAESSKLTGPRL